MTDAAETVDIDEAKKKIIPDRPKSKYEEMVHAGSELRKEMLEKNETYSQIVSALEAATDDDERLQVKAAMSEALGGIFKNIKYLANNSREAVRYSLAHTFVFLRAVSDNQNFIDTNFKGDGRNKIWEKEVLTQVYKLEDHPNRLTTYARGFKYIADNWAEADGSLDNAKDVFSWIEDKKGIAAIYALATKGSDDDDDDTDISDTPGYQEADDTFETRSWGSVALPQNKDVPKIKDGANVLLVGRLKDGQIEIKHIVEKPENQIGKIMEKLGDDLIAAKPLPDHNLFWRRVASLSSVVTGKDKVVSINTAGSKCTISNERTGYPSLVAQVKFDGAPIFRENAGRQRLESEPGAALKKLTAAALVASHKVAYGGADTEVTIEWSDEADKKTEIALMHLIAGSNKDVAQYEPGNLNDWVDLTLDKTAIDLVCTDLVDKWNDLSKAAKDDDKDYLAQAKEDFKSKKGKLARVESTVILEKGSDKMSIVTPYVNKAGFNVTLPSEADGDVKFFFKTADLRKVFAFIKNDKTEKVKVSFNESMMKFVTEGWAIHIPYADNGNYRTNGFVPKD
jgi:hypothetical protein